MNRWLFLLIQLRYPHSLANILGPITMHTQNIGLDPIWSDLEAQGCEGKIQTPWICLVCCTIDRSQ